MMTKPNTQRTSVAQCVPPAGLWAKSANRNVAQVSNRFPTGFQPAVSPISNRQHVLQPSALCKFKARAGWKHCDTAGWKPALRLCPPPCPRRTRLTSALIVLPLLRTSFPLMRRVLLRSMNIYKLVQTPSGGQYTEMADGLCYQDPQDGTWKDSVELIEIIDADGTAVARLGQQRVTFSPNANTPGGAIDLLTPDGKRLVSKVLGVVLYDAASGQSTLISELKDSVGKLVSSNQIIYEDAFDGDGLIADLRYTWRKGSFEQDLILRQLPRDFSPKAWGMDPATSRIEIWTEFFARAGSGTTD